MNVKYVICAACVALASASYSHAGVIYTSGTFPSDPPSSNGQALNTVRGSGSGYTISNVTDVPDGSWWGAQHGLNYDQLGWYSTGAGTGTLFFSPNHRVADTFFVGLDTPIADVTNVMTNVGSGGTDPSTYNQALALYIAPTAGSPGDWYISATTFSSFNSAYTTSNPVGNSFTFGLSGEFYKFTPDAANPITPDPDFGSTPVLLPSSGVLLAAGIYTNYSPNSGFVNINSFTVNGNAVPEPASALLLLPALGVLALMKRKRHLAQRA